MSQQLYSEIMPCFRYQDAPAAIDWLCRAFGFERQLIVPGPNNTIAHAQLTYRKSMIMLGSGQNDGEYGRRVTSPAQAKGLNTQTIYVVVEDADIHYAHAKAAGATIFIEIKNEDYGGRGYSCLDLEGHIWSFGTYDPWVKT
jgi:uncharacterized glyoxalase superfamily protein PhnB